MKKYLLLFSVIVAVFHADLLSQTLVKNMSSTDGIVYAVYKNAGKYYVGGLFNYVGLLTGSSALTTAGNDYPNMSFPAFNSTSRAAWPMVREAGTSAVILVTMMALSLTVSCTYYRTAQLTPHSV